MNPPDTAEIAAVEGGELIGFATPAVRARRLPLRRARRRWEISAEQRAAIRDVAGALLISRVAIWIVGICSVLALGARASNAFDPPGVTAGFGRISDLLAAPAARWDGAWYLVIAGHGYHPELGLATGARSAFFPLYPWLVGMLGGNTAAGMVVAGIVISLLALAAALYGLHRLVSLELAGSHPWAHPQVPRLTVALTAFAPMAFFFSAIYSESLYLALSVGVFLCARRGRWMWAGVLGGLAAATRSAGVVLLLPVLLLYLYGPREDRPVDRIRGLLPRYRLRADLAWAALIPAGLLAYMAYLALHGGDALMPFHAQNTWNRAFAGPFGGLKDGAVAAWDGVRQLLSGARHPVLYPLAGGSPFVAAGHNIELFAFLLLAVLPLLAVLRRLPIAYGAYILAALAMPLSYPVLAQPLMSLPRFLLVLFPLNIALAAVLARHRRTAWVVLALSTVAMLFFSGQFATWHWVA